MMIDNPQLMQMIVQKHALKLEMLGMKRRGRSVYSIIKEEFGLKGNRQKVYDTMTEIINTIQQQEGEA